MIGAHDTILSPVGVEDPVNHIVRVNGMDVIVAIELKLITLIGPSIKSAGSEYRSLNAINKRVKQLLNHDAKSQPLFYSIKKALSDATKKDTVKSGGYDLASVTKHGIDFCIIYYLLVKRFYRAEDQLINLNSVTSIVPIITIVDEVLEKASIKLPHGDLSTFSDFLLRDEANGLIGSKMRPISQFEMLDPKNTKFPIWKSMYIQRILSGILNQPIVQTNSYFLRTLDYGIIRGVMKRIFMNSKLRSKIEFGSKMRYIQTAAIEQTKLSKELKKLNDGELKHELVDIHHIAKELSNATVDIDFALDDICLITFHRHGGETLYQEFSKFIDVSKENNRLSATPLVSSMITNKETFRRVIFDYLYALYLLTKHGIIHNDPHFNNIIISKAERGGNKIEKQTFYLGNRQLSMPTCGINLTLIDYDKSILSHHHSNEFDQSVKVINEEVGIVFDSVKETIVSDYDQIFSCYSMYDIVRFCLIMKQILDDIESAMHSLVPKAIMASHHKFLDDILKKSTDILYKIFDPSATLPFDKSVHGSSLEWLIESFYGAHARVSKTKSSISKTSSMGMNEESFGNRPGFVSSRRRYADTLKEAYFAEYISSMLMEK